MSINFFQATSLQNIKKNKFSVTTAFEPYSLLQVTKVYRVVTSWSMVNDLFLMLDYVRVINFSIIIIIFIIFTPCSKETRG